MSIIFPHPEIFNRRKLGNIQPALTIDALHHGNHVFVEKPSALSLDHCDAMIDAANEANRFLMVGQILRFETEYDMAKDEIVTSRLGRIISIHVRRNRPNTLLPGYGRTYSALENCIHDIDLMLWYAQSKVRRVRGYGRSATGGLNHDTFWGIMEFENGTINVVETRWLIRPGSGVMLDDELQVIGDKSVANIRLVPESLELRRENVPETPDTGYDPRISDFARGILREESAYSCNCVPNRRPQEVIKGQEAKAAVEVALSLGKSAKANREIGLASSVEAHD